MIQSSTIQPAGFYLHLSSDWLVNGVSANVGDFLPVAVDETLGQPITALLCDDAIHDVRNRMALLRGDDMIEHLLHVALVDDGTPFDLSIFRDGDGFGIDAEPCEGHPFGNSTGVVEGMLARVSAADNVDSLASDAARQLRALTGFDRALFYGDGALLGRSERSPATPSAQSTPVPPSHDLAVVDCAAEPVAILGSSDRKEHRTTLRPPTGAEAAMLAAGEVRAALIVPLERDERPWGHVACYHPTPRHLGVERRGIARLFARIIALRIENIELRRG